MVRGVRKIAVLQIFGGDRDEATVKAKIHKIHKGSGTAGVNEKFEAGANLCMLSAMFKAMDKKQQDIITVSFIAVYCLWWILITNRIVVHI